MNHDTLIAIGALLLYPILTVLMVVIMLLVQALS